MRPPNQYLIDNRLYTIKDLLFHPDNIYGLGRKGISARIKELRSKKPGVLQMSAIMAEPTNLKKFYDVEGKSYTFQELLKMAQGKLTTNALRKRLDYAKRHKRPLSMEALLKPPDRLSINRKGPRMSRHARRNCPPKHTHKLGSWVGVAFAIGITP